jgi:hypothetical protein
MFRRFVAAVVVAATLVVPSLALAGNKAGPQVLSTRVEARKSDNYAVTLIAGEETRVLVTGDGDTDLDCYLSDENGNVVARDIDKGDTCLLTMTPKWTGEFHIEVRNMGTVYNRYTIRTN